MHAGDLKVGDTVQTKNGTEKLTKKEKNIGRHQVYHLEVHQAHTYYVSNIGVLAHNTKGGLFKKDFKPGQDIAHYNKHREEIMQTLGYSSYSLEQYMKDALHTINSGKYVPEMNGYVKLIGGKGSAKFSFVGLDRKTGDITTFHIKSADELARRAPSLGIER
tara:strand:+ start:80 stop:565 length:486 start_codon:yes stop_codon:yes gene_type:complete